jgi:hypothetical protein
LKSTVQRCPQLVGQHLVTMYALLASSPYFQPWGSANSRVGVFRGATQSVKSVDRAMGPHGPRLPTKDPSHGTGPRVSVGITGGNCMQLGVG